MMKQEMRKMNEALNAAGVALKCNVPQRMPAMSYMVLRPGVKRAREAMARVERLSGGGEGEALSLLENGVLLYTREGRSTAAQVSETDAVDAAERFLTRVAGPPSGLKVDFVTRKGTLWNVHCYAEVDGWPLFGSYAVVSVDGNGVSEARMAWFELAGYGEEKRTVVPATEAVMKTIAFRKDLSGRAIVSVRLGYYTESYDAKEWEPTPVWRVLFDDGSPVYVNALTGEIERPGVVGKYR